MGYPGKIRYAVTDVNLTPMESAAHSIGQAGQAEITEHTKIKKIFYNANRILYSTLG